MIQNILAVGLAVGSWGMNVAPVVAATPEQPTEQEKSKMRGTCLADTQNGVYWIPGWAFQCREGLLESWWRTDN